MSAAGFRNFRSGLMFATALSVCALPSAGRAYTADEQQACSGDAFRLCSAAIPDVDRVTVCMTRNKAQLSPGCRAFFRSDPAPAAAAGRPMSIKPVTARKPVAAKRPKRKKPVKPAAT